MKIVTAFLVFCASVPAAANDWIQTDWSGGPGQLSWSDSTSYHTGNFVDGWVSAGDLLLHANDSDWVNTGELAGASYVWTVIETSGGVLYAGTYPNGDVFTSVDGGATWVNTEELAGVGRVTSLMETRDSGLYAGTSFNGDAFRSLDGGATWVSTGDLAGATWIYALLESRDGALFASTTPSGDVFKTIDAGTTWSNTGELVGAVDAWSLLEASDGSLYAGTYPGGDVFKSVDAGSTWVNTGELAGSARVYSLIGTSDGALYAGTGFNGDVFRSVDAGATWTNTGELVGVAYVYSLLEAGDGVLYAGTDLNGDVLKSIDSGATWITTGDLTGATTVHSILQASDGILYAATADIGDVFKTHYFASGDLVSSVYDTEDTNVSYGTMTWNETLNGQTVFLRVRTDTSADMFTAPDWTACEPVINGMDISSLSSVDDTEQYIQYRVELSTSSPDTSPIVHEVVIGYDVPGVEEARSTFNVQRLTFALCQNDPNPFHRSTHITYWIPMTSSVTLDVYDVTGRLVEMLVDETQQPGIHQVRWERSASPSGVYFYRLKACPERSPEPGEGQSRRAGEFVETRKMVLID